MIQEIKLPPLPSYMDSVTPEQFAERVREWGRAAVEADRRERGEPVAEVYRMHYGNRMGNIGVNAVRALLPPDDLPPPGTKLYAAPVAAQAQPPVVARMDDGSTTRGVGKTAYRVVTAETKAEMPTLVAAAYSTPLGVIPSTAVLHHQPVAFAKDGVLFWHGEHAAWRGFNGDLYLSQPCDHIFEARPIDGSRSAAAPCEPVCMKCGYRPGEGG